MGGQAPPSLDHQSSEEVTTSLDLQGGRELFYEGKERLRGQAEGRFQGYSGAFCGYSTLSDSLAHEANQSLHDAPLPPTFGK